MNRIAKERDRLLAAAARVTGMLSALTALLCLILPYALSTGREIAVAALLVAVLIGFLRLSASTSIWWVVVLEVLAVASLRVATGGVDPTNTATSYALGVIAGGVVGALGIMLLTTGPRIVLFVLSLVASLTALFLRDTHAAYTFHAIVIGLGGWAFCAVLALWLGRIVPQAMLRISAMSDAYRAERVASETEARRRQGARLLHDTVLATLTLLAHSGVGVSEQALREQAGQDAALLRQLRMGYTPNPEASGEYKLRPVEESTLGNTLESVKQRFRRMGLEVTWHGKGQVLLPSDTLDAFLLALAESLENVRRHSGVGEAHVTITDDDSSVRAMVTDDGVGFSAEDIPHGRLGFTESIVARLRDVGGDARLFSAPGSGTTVVLEVPK
ncbi:sensor histidine kinase [Gryllotalpicola reticulitermitis]|uniref:Sensor histidine kinase n=1 Tax=Gryllotalpicola reticulitermitis TaxID=1184153 RepID=A0ABV8QA74_9MICO